MCSSDLEIEEKSRDTEITSEGISSLTEEALTAGMAFLAEATPESVEQPFDITFLMSDAELTDGEGWSSKSPCAAGLAGCCASLPGAFTASPLSI